MTIQLNAASRLNQVSAGSWGFGPLDTDGSADNNNMLLRKIFSVCKKSEMAALKEKSDAGFNNNIMSSWIGTVCGLMAMNFPIDKNAWLTKINAEIESIKQEGASKRVLNSYNSLLADVKSYKQVKHKYGVLNSNEHDDV